MQIDDATSHFPHPFGENKSCSLSEISVFHVSSSGYLETNVLLIATHCHPAFGKRRALDRETIEAGKIRMIR